MRLPSAFRTLSALLALTTPAMAQDVQLQLPLDCDLGETCFIQQYVDTDPGPGAQDFMGGPLSYDGHKGTDFRITDLAAMQAGVAVFAPALPGPEAAPRRARKPRRLPSARGPRAPPATADAPRAGEASSASATRRRAMPRPIRPSGSRRRPYRRRRWEGTWRWSRPG